MSLFQLGTKSNFAEFLGNESLRLTGTMWRGLLGQEENAMIYRRFFGSVLPHRCAKYASYRIRRKPLIGSVLPPMCHGLPVNRAGSGQVLIYWLLSLTVLALWVSPGFAVESANQPSVVGVGIAPIATVAKRIAGDDVTVDRKSVV